MTLSQTGLFPRLCDGWMHVAGYLRGWLCVGNETRLFDISHHCGLFANACNAPTTLNSWRASALEGESRDGFPSSDSSKVCMRVCLARVLALTLPACRYAHVP